MMDSTHRLHDDALTPEPLVEPEPPSNSLFPIETPDTPITPPVPCLPPFSFLPPRVIVHEIVAHLIVSIFYRSPDSSKEKTLLFTFDPTGRFFPLRWNSLFGYFMLDRGRFCWQIFTSIDIPLNWKVPLVRQFPFFGFHHHILIDTDALPSALIPTAGPLLLENLVCRRQSLRTFGVSEASFRVLRKVFRIGPDWALPNVLTLILRDFRGDFALESESAPASESEPEGEREEEEGEGKREEEEEGEREEDTSSSLVDVDEQQPVLLSAFPAVPSVENLSLIEWKGPSASLGPTAFEMMSSFSPRFLRCVDSMILFSVLGIPSIASRLEELEFYFDPRRESGLGGFQTNVLDLAECSLSFPCLRVAVFKLGVSVGVAQQNVMRVLRSCTQTLERLRLSLQQTRTLRNELSGDFPRLEWLHVENVICSKMICPSLERLRLKDSDPPIFEFCDLKNLVVSGLERFPLTKFLAAPNGLESLKLSVRFDADAAVLRGDTLIFATSWCVKKLKSIGLDSRTVKKPSFVVRFDYGLVFPSLEILMMSTVSLPYQSGFYKRHFPKLRVLGLPILFNPTRRELELPLLEELWVGPSAGCLTEIFRPGSFYAHLRRLFIHDFYVGRYETPPMNDSLLAFLCQEQPKAAFDSVKVFCYATPYAPSHWNPVGVMSWDESLGGEVVLEETGFRCAFGGRKFFNTRGELRFQEAEPWNRTSLRPELWKLTERFRAQFGSSPWEKKKEEDE